MYSRIQSGGGNWLLTTIKIIFKWFVNGSYDGWGQSWYLFATIWGILLIIWLRKYVSDSVLFSLGIIIEICFIIKDSVIGNSFGWFELTFIRAIFYLMTGLMLAKHPDIFEKVKNKLSNKSRTLCLIVFVGAFAVEAILLWKFNGISYTAEIEPLTGITAIVVFIWAMCANVHLKHAKITREMSTFIYCLHYLFSHIIFKDVYFAIPWSKWILVMGLCLISYAIFYKLKSKIKVLNYFV